MAAAKKNDKPLEIPPQRIEYVDVFVGGSLLVVHRFGQKARKEILDKQMGKAKVKKGIRDPHSEYLESKYLAQEGGWDGLPCAAFRRGMIDAASFVKDVTKVQIRGAVFVVAEGRDQDGMNIVPVSYKREYMREDVVRLPNGSADLRFRACYEDWGVKLKLKTDPDVLSPENIHYLIQRAGFSIGICESRPQKSGEWGQYELLEEKDYTTLLRKTKIKKVA